MREPLYRGKRADNGEWVYGDIRWLDNLVGIYPRDDEHPNCIYAIVDVIPETVGEYTGVIDKNSKKIFEGDIHCNYDNIEKKNRYFIVRFGEFKDTVYCFEAYGWYFQEINCAVGELLESFGGNENQYVNIIGNIHDNPDLLENDNDK